MLPKFHLIASVILIVILFPFFGVYSLLVLLSGFFIDIDHVFYYAVKFRKFNLRKNYDYFIEMTMREDDKENNKVIVIFHSIEFIVLIMILSFFYKIFLVLLIGLVIHIVMDVIYQYRISERITLLFLTLRIIKVIKNE